MFKGLTLIFKALAAALLFVGVIFAFLKIFPDLKDDADVRSAKAYVREQLAAGKKEILVSEMFPDYKNAAKVCLSIRSYVEGADYYFYFLSEERAAKPIYLDDKSRLHAADWLLKLNDNFYGLRYEGFDRGKYKAGSRHCFEYNHAILKVEPGIQPKYFFLIFTERLKK